MSEVEPTKAVTENARIFLNKLGIVSSRPLITRRARRRHQSYMNGLMSRGPSGFVARAVSHFSTPEEGCHRVRNYPHQPSPYANRKITQRIVNVVVVVNYSERPA